MLLLNRNLQVQVYKISFQLHFVAQTDKHALSFHRPPLFPPITVLWSTSGRDRGGGFTYGGHGFGGSSVFTFLVRKVVEGGRHTVFGTQSHDAGLFESARVILHCENYVHELVFVLLECAS
jgi:hypothetical protein